MSHMKGSTLLTSIPDLYIWGGSWYYLVAFAAVCWLTLVS